MFWICRVGLSAAAPLGEGGPATSPVTPTVEFEDEVCSYANADNGAGPMWRHGSTCLVRTSADVFIAGIETRS